jgi:hypothetical protein
MTNRRHAWLAAAAVTVGVGVAEPATVLHLIPGTTTVDTGALLLTGFLAGLFLGFHLAWRRAMSTDQRDRPSWHTVRTDVRKSPAAGVGSDLADRGSSPCL